MWRQWLARIMDRPASDAGPTNDPAQTSVPTHRAALLSASEIAAAEDAILLFDELAQPRAIV